MLHEHAVTYNGQLSVADLDYIIRKANKLGRIGRDIIQVVEEIDDEGIHVFFDVTGMGHEQRRVAEKV